MKWSSFIQDHYKQQPQPEPSHKLITTSSRLLDRKTRPLTLKSIEKVKNHSNSMNKNNVSFNSSEGKYSSYKLKLNNKHNQTLSKNQIENNEVSASRCLISAHQSEEIGKFVVRFGRELEELMRSTVEMVEKERYRREYKEEMHKRMAEVIQEAIMKYIPDCKLTIPSKSQLDTPLKNIGFDSAELKQFITNSSNLSRDENTDSVIKRFRTNIVQKNNNQLKQKKYSKIMQFKRNKVQEKNGIIKNAREDHEGKHEQIDYEKVTNAFEQINTILDNKRQNKVNRKSRFKRQNSNSRYSEASSESVEDILSKTLQNSRKSYKSRLKGNEAMYNMSKMLNE